MTWQLFLESSGALLIGAFLLDLVLGDPRWIPHPVVLMGKFITWGERLLWSGKPRRDLLAGGLLSVSLIVLSFGGAWGLVALFSFLPLPFTFLLLTFLASMTLAMRGLLDAVARIEKPLRAGNLVGARKELSRIVGRETGSLSEDKVLRASLESLAENTCDGIVAPLFYLFLGGVPAAMAYKAANTLDSMIGYQTERYLYFGRFAARLDDCLNFVPARLTAFFMVIASYLVRLDGARACRVIWRDHAKHLSPNAGYPEAALAGAFGIRLGGPSIYFGREILKPTIGQEIISVHIEMLKEAQRLCLISAALSLVTFLLLL